LAQSEAERREGFYEHLREQKEHDIERTKGLKEYLREEADWEEQRKHDAKADKSRKKAESPVEDGPEYKADLQKKYQDYEGYQAERRNYVKYKKSQEARNAKEQEQRDAWALEEYGLDKDLPRFDVAKRNLSGGKGSGGGSFGSGGGRFGGSGSSDSGGGGMSFPPPPPIDDFGGGYVPPRLHLRFLILQLRICFRRKLQFHFRLQAETSIPIMEEVFTNPLRRQCRTAVDLMRVSRFSYLGAGAGFCTKS